MIKVNFYSKNTRWKVNFMPESKKVSGILWSSVKNEFIFHLKEITYYALSLLNAKDLYWVLVQSFLIRQEFSIQKGYNRSKIEKEIITIIFSILKWDWITNFRLNRHFWFFEQDLPKKGASSPIWPLISSSLLSRLVLK